MLNEDFYIDGKSALAYGIHLQRPIQFTGAEPVFETVHIDGRNGDLAIDTGAYKNRIGTAECFCLHHDVEVAVRMATSFLLSTKGYRRLESTNDPRHYWMARVINGPQIENRLRMLNPFTVEFDCMPQRFVKHGENPITILTGTSLYNHTSFPALPIITVTGSGAGRLQVGGYVVDILSLDGRITLDCDTQNAYKDTQNRNMDISCGEFPRLEVGENDISYTDGITGVEIIPRWWTL